MTKDKWPSGELSTLLTHPPFPSVATVEVALRSCLRSLSGFSVYPTEDRLGDADGWPDVEADETLLSCLRLLIISMVAIVRQDGSIERPLRIAISQSQRLKPMTLGSANSTIAACRGTAELCHSSLFEKSSYGSARNKFFEILRLSNIAETGANSEGMIETDDHSGSVGPNAILINEPLYSAWADREEISDPSEVEARIDSFLGHEVISGLYQRRTRGFGFWANWFEGFMYGRPQSWELQEQIALIPDQEWEAGPERIAELIEEIEARFEVRRAKDGLKVELRTASIDRLGIGGNFPPEPLDDDARIDRRFEVIWASLKNLEEELERQQPDKARVKDVLSILQNIMVSTGSYAARKVDLAIDVGIKAGIPGAIGYAALNPEKISALIKAIQKWLPLI